MGRTYNFIYSLMNQDKTCQMDLIELCLVAKQTHKIQQQPPQFLETVCLFGVLLDFLCLVQNVVRIWWQPKVHISFLLACSCWLVHGLHRVLIMHICAVVPEEALVLSRKQYIKYWDKIYKCFSWPEKLADQIPAFEIHARTRMSNYIIKKYITLPDSFYPFWYKLY